MTALARAFSAIVLVLLIAAVVAIVWLRPAPDLPPAVPLSGQVDRIVIEKSARRMTLLQDGQILRSYVIALGFTPEGDKLREGDGRTPEGLFRIDRRNDRSAYHLSLGLDYPQQNDRDRAAAAGENPGGDIMIHGQPNVLPDTLALTGDWTAGCIALTNDEIREIWQVTPIGTPVEIRP